jgi:cytochrome P450
MLSNSPTTEDLVFDPYDPETMREPWPIYARLRDEEPVHRMKRSGAFVLSRFEDVFRSARDTETFSSAKGLTFTEGGEVAKLGLKPTMVMMDPPDHTRFRRYVSRGFTPRRVADLEPALRAFVKQRITAMLESGECDFVEELARPVPSFVVAHYLGVPVEDRGLFDEWTEALVQANTNESYGDALDALLGLYEYFTRLVERRRADPGDDMISALVQLDLEGTDLSVDEILGYAFVMIAGGNDTATGLLAGTAEHLTRRRDQRQELLDDRGLIPGAVEELLRFTSPVQGLSRTVTKAVTIEDIPIEAGSKVHLLYGAANRDPREFGPSAGELDVTRPVPRMLTFSSGPHFCLGAAAARLQGRVVLEEMLERMPDFEVDVDRGRFAGGAFVRRHEYLPGRTTT